MIDAKAPVTPVKSAKGLEKQLEAQLRAAERAATSCAFLAPIFDFLTASATWPREILEARFAHELGEPPRPGMSHRRIREAIAYRLQELAYTAAGRPIPAHVARRAVERIRSSQSSTRAASFAPSAANDDPRADSWIIPDEARVKCAVNPFQRGDNWTLAQLIIGAGDSGIAFAALAQLCVDILRDATPSAHARAMRCFTEYVAAGQMTIGFEFGNLAGPPIV